MVWTKVFNQVSSIRVKSVTDSLFKFGMIGLLIGVISAIFSDKDWIVIIVFSFSALFILIGLFFYCFFAIKKPDYLRSEEYQTQKQALELLGDNERANNPNLSNIHLITNPNAPKLNNDNNNPLTE
ncbi:hypothetical protein [uncultured Psychroserpens sp.]|uniref:hypothetical protein n=1 Tax=uncultured Psychroserpens sp. TaxID=255436 RepID=UPI002604C1F7|nr:hypothetical protein [uncultured Psychroserpens sp.]